MAAGPIYVLVGLGQAWTREGFYMRRHALSLLANGDLGWIQVAYFLIAGILWSLARSARGASCTAGAAARRTWARYSAQRRPSSPRAAIASGQASPAIILGFYVAVAWMWIWHAAVHRRLMRESGADEAPGQSAAYGSLDRAI